MVSQSCEITKTIQPTFLSTTPNAEIKYHGAIFATMCWLTDEYQHHCASHQSKLPSLKTTEKKRRFTNDTDIIVYWLKKNLITVHEIFN